MQAQLRRAEFRRIARRQASTGLVSKDGTPYCGPRRPSPVHRRRAAVRSGSNDADSRGAGAHRVFARLTPLAKTEVGKLKGSQVRQPALGYLLPSPALDDDRDADHMGARFREGIDGCQHGAACR